MPVQHGTDTKGHYFQWGGQKKYYYTTAQGAQIAYARACKQGRAIELAQARTKGVWAGEVLPPK